MLIVIGQKHFYCVFFVNLLSGNLQLFAVNIPAECDCIIDELARQWSRLAKWPFAAS